MDGLGPLGGASCESSSEFFNGVSDDFEFVLGGWAATGIPGHVSKK